MSEYKFSIPVKVRIMDINYGNHVSYAYYFLYFHDARIEYFTNLGFSEMNLGGCGIIITEANCKYKKELILGDELIIKCKISNIRSKGFDMNYVIERDNVICAEGTTSILCFDYENKKAMGVPEIFLKAVKKFEEIS